MARNPQQAMLTYKKLHVEKIVDKIDFLSRRVEEHFPGSGLSKVCIELHGIASESERVCRWISKPHKWIRFVVAVVIVLVVAALVMTLISLKIPQGSFALTEFVAVFEAALSAIVLIGAALVFLITAEARIKRTRTLKSINELRAIAHVIDIHQLTKDPARILPTPTTSSPKKQVTAYELAR